ncbi:hypothetical protein RE6C_02483 [Rhodopirellula europaea 6C]|uniref:Uncharacterized protein n=1 Tax=Rhodopirellula europaea 6C TaxID=1263867 RepID=M2AI79_9BACT|nr:hypothetical protein RE6C_02483 [Rhodopirellula europaea 6C]
MFSHVRKSYRDGMFSEAALTTRSFDCGGLSREDPLQGVGMQFRTPVRPQNSLKTRLAD